MEPATATTPESAELAPSGDGPTAPVAEAPRPLTDEELREGWIALFDGESLFGWKATSNANWRVADGTIVVDSGDKGLLCTTSQFSDYVLRLDFRSAEGTNSGVFLHTPLQPQDPAHDCYELNIAGKDNPFPTCSLVKRQQAAGDYDSRDWQTFDVTVRGEHVTVAWNGQTALEYVDPRPLRRGHIGLQLNSGQVEFRRVRLRPLEPRSLFNGQDLTGWKTYPEMASKFTVSPSGELHVRDGRGQLETEEQFGDFVLQLEAIAHAPSLNSGVFFRCIPGDVMMGYECQIHNGFRDGDRRRPVDCGTGGIFRRQDARLVAANDQQWFHLTLVADGPHMAAWVNGYHVSDWIDERPAHDNPRQGLRLAPGTIMLQGHDPTTNLSFRNLRITPLATRADVPAADGLSESGSNSLEAARS